MRIRRIKGTYQTYIWGYIMIAPVTLGLIWLYVIPFVQNIMYTFMEIGTFGKGHFNGVENYKALIKDPIIWRSLFNTFVYVITVVPISIFIGLVIAACLNTDIRHKNIYRTLYFLPYITMPTAIGIVWRYIFRKDFGLINGIISNLGIHNIPWLEHPVLAKISIIAVIVWWVLGYNMILFLGGMQSIPPYYYEAARLDGASATYRFFHITIPLLSPTIFFVTVIQTINMFQLFDIIFLMIPFRSPISNAVASVGVYYYKLAFTINDKGLAATSALMLFIVILCITLVQFRIQKKWVTYDLA